MTGLCYRAIDFGPVPDRWDRVYSEFDDIRQEPRPIGEYEGNVLVTDAAADESLLSVEDKQIITAVCNRFGSCTSREISTISHEEQAWQKYCATHSRIPFSEAYSLKAI